MQHILKMLRYVGSLSMSNLVYRRPSFRFYDFDHHHGFFLADRAL